MITDMKLRKCAWLLAGAALLILACSDAPLVNPPATGVHMMRFAVDDQPPMGNGDSIVNPGETVSLRTWVRNLDSSVAENVVCYLRLSYADPNVTLLDTVVSLGDIGPLDSAYVGDSAFRFSLAASCSTGHALPLELVSYDETDSARHDRYGLRVGVAALRAVPRVVLAEMVGQLF